MDNMNMDFDFESIFNKCYTFPTPLANNGFNIYNLPTIEPKKIKAVVKGTQYLVIGEKSINMDYIVSFESNNEYFYIRTVEYHYQFQKELIENFNEIANMIYSYYDCKHGKNL